MKRFVALSCVFLIALSSGASGQTQNPPLTAAEINRALLNQSLGVGTLTFSAHIISAGTAPIISACGTTPSLNATATDHKGTITEGAVATGCAITFTTAYATAPDCTISSPTGNAVSSYSASTTALTIANVSASGDKFTYSCTQ